MLAVGARLLVIALDAVEAAPIAGSGDLTALGSRRGVGVGSIWRRGSVLGVLAIGLATASALGRSAGKGGEHDVSWWTRELEMVEGDEWEEAGQRG